jgi:DNA-binding transcriptional ArsR family regulator
MSPDTTTVDAPGGAPIPDLDAIDVVTVLHALADPVRLQIVRQLARCPGAGEMTCGQIELPVTKSTASHHLKTLACAGITTERAEGTRKWIRLRRADLDRRFPGLIDSVLSAPSRDGSPPDGKARYTA